MRASRLPNQCKRAGSLLQAWGRYTVCVFASRLHHQSSRTRSLCQAWRQRGMRTSRLYDQCTRAWSLPQAWRRYTVCVRTSRLYYQSHYTRSLYQAWTQRVCIQPAPPEQAHTVSALRMEAMHGGTTKSVYGHPGCTTIAQARGICAMHAGKRVCKHSGCSTNANARSLCGKHGATHKQGDTIHQFAPPPPVRTYGLCHTHGVAMSNADSRSR
jgi:hypothetical protein